MKIAIDISQLAYEKTGVSNYLKQFIISLLQKDLTNEYILFFSSTRKKLDTSFLKEIKNPHVTVRVFRFPPLVLHFVWNIAHTFPIEKLLGDLDIFISSDWTQPPSIKAKLATIVYDLIVYKYPEETSSKWKISFPRLRITPNIVEVQKKRFNWIKNEVSLIFCISQSTKNDLIQLLGIPQEKIKVTYPGLSI